MDKVLKDKEMLIDKLDLIKDNNKFLGFSLSKSQWVCLYKTILNKCLSFFDIQEVNWE